MAENRFTPLTCKVCLYFDSKDYGRGYCRRRSPQDTGGVKHVWPVVRDDEWCGEGRTVESAEPLVEIHHKQQYDQPPITESQRELFEKGLSNMMRDPRYWRDHDPEFVKEITDGFRRLYPGDVQK